MTTTRAPLRVRSNRPACGRRALLLLALLASSFCKRGTPPAPGGEDDDARAPGDAATESRGTGVRRAGRNGTLASSAVTPTR